MRGPMATLLTLEDFESFKFLALNKFKMLTQSNKLLPKKSHTDEPVTKFTECWQIFLLSLGLSLKKHLLSDKVINKDNFPKIIFHVTYLSMCTRAFPGSVSRLQPTLYMSMHVISGVGWHKIKYYSICCHLTHRLGVCPWLGFGRLVLFGWLVLGFFFSFWHCSETEYTVGFKSVAENTKYTFFTSQVRLRNCWLLTENYRR